MEELIRKREMELNEFTFNNFLPEEKLDNTLNFERTKFNLEQLQMEREQSLTKSTENETNMAKYSLFFRDKEIPLEIEGAQESYDPILHLKESSFNKISFDFTEFKENENYQFDSKLFLSAKAKNKEFNNMFTSNGTMIADYGTYDERLEQMGIKREIKNSYITFVKSGSTRVIFTYENNKMYLNKCIIATAFFDNFPNYCRENNIEMY